MTVAELIVKLQEMVPEHEVKLVDRYDLWGDRDIESVSVYDWRDGTKQVELS